MSDQHFYDEVARELREAPAHPGLWAKAYALSEGDEPKSRARYIALRVEQLQAELVAQQNAQRQREQLEQFEEQQQVRAREQAKQEAERIAYLQTQAQLPWLRRDATPILAVLGILLLLFVVDFIVMAIRAQK